MRKVLFLSLLLFLTFPLVAGLPSWLQKPWNDIYNANLLALIFDFWYGFLGEGFFWIMSIALIGLGVYMRSGTIGVGVSLFILGTFMATILPYEVHVYGSIILLMAIAILLYGIVKKR